MNDLLISLDLTGFVMGYCLFWGVVAGLCRGFAGFGLSAILIVALSLFLVPREVVPIAVLLETFASLVMMRMTWSEIRWRLLGWLMLGAAVGTPLGVLVLSKLPAEPLRIGISLIVLAASLVLWRGLTARWENDTAPNDRGRADFRPF